MMKSSDMKPMEYAPVVSGHAAIESTGPKMGHKCCGGCCDMRRAVVICDIILLVGGVITLAVEVLGVYGASAVANMSFDDDAFTDMTSGDDATAQDIKDSMAEAQLDLKQAEDLLMGLMVITIIALVTTAGSLWGALKYNYWPVAANAVCLGVRAILPALMGAPPNILAVAITGLWIYPHVVFCLEVRSGIMSKETYEREVFSCCCNADRGVVVPAPGTSIVAQAEMI